MPPPRRIDPRQQQRAVALCADWVGKHSGTANFDQLYRMLMEQGFEAEHAHLALEKYMHDNMMKRVKKPAPG